MNKRIVIILLLIFTLNFPVIAQHNLKIDSLQEVYEKHLLSNGSDTITVKILVELYDETKFSDPFGAVQYVAIALQLYHEIGDKKGIGKMNRLLGNNYYYREIYPMAMDAYTKSLEIFNSIKDTSETAYSYLKIGETYLSQRLEKNATASFENAYRLFQSIDDRRGISFVLDEYAKLLATKFNDEDALDSLVKSLSIREQIKDKSLVGLSFENIGDLYFQLDQYSKSIEYYEKAIGKYTIAGEFLNVAEIRYNLAGIYYTAKDYKKAKDNYEEALMIFIDAGIAYKTSRTQNNLSYISMDEGDYKEALRLAEKSLTTSIAFNISSVTADSYKLYGEIFAKQEKFKLAYKYMQLSAQMKDSIAVEKQNNQSNELQVNLATQKKEQEIKILEKEQEIQKAQIDKNSAQRRTLFIGIISLFVVLGFVLFFVYYFYKTNKNTKKANLLLIEKNEEIIRQNAEIESQRSKLEHANVSITKQRDEIEAKNEKITSSINYASRIQRAMLPKIAEIKEKLPEVFVMLSPREAVSGDFIWYGTTLNMNNEEKIIIAAVDCTGHGVPGAFMSMIGDAYLNQIVYQQKISSPENILEELHKGIRTSLQQDKSSNTDGMDMSICVIDKKKKIIEYAGAKNPLFYIQDEKMFVVKGSPYSIGGIIRSETNVFEKHVIDISVPTIFYLYSDGFQDQFGLEDNKTRKYMARHFREFLYKIHKRPMENQAGDLAVEFDDWRGKYSQMDDLLIIGVRLDCSSRD